MRAYTFPFLMFVMNVLFAAVNIPFAMEGKAMNTVALYVSTVAALFHAADYFRKLDR